MPRVLFPNIPMRMVLQPRNKLAQNLKGVGSRSDPTSSNRDRRRQDEGAWSKVVMHTTPSTNKFEIKQYLSKVYNLDVKKVRAALRTRQPATPARHPPATARHLSTRRPPPPRAPLQVNTLNMDGRLRNSMSGRKMYKKKRFPDYKKVFVKVGSAPADIGVEDGDDADWPGFVVPVKTDHGPGVQPLPIAEKYKMNQETHWLNRLPWRSGSEDDDEDYEESAAVVAATSSEPFAPNRRASGRYGTHACARLWLRASRRRAVSPSLTDRVL